METILETKLCKHCEANFEATQKDRDFYDKISPVFNNEKQQIPDPSLCPDCRNQKRLSFFNYRSLYKNICNHCSKQMIARFPETSDYKVLCLECWSRSKMDSLEK